MSKLNYQQINCRQKEKGVVLVITLIVLLIVTMLASSAVQVTSLYERMARNGSDTAVAFQAAEAALMEAEAIVEVETSTASYALNANGKYEIVAAGAVTRWEVDSTWTGSNFLNAAYSDGVSQPAYIIEFVRTLLSEEDRLNLDNVGGGSGSDRTQVFKVTARGKGKTDSAEVYLQSTYGKKF